MEGRIASAAGEPNYVVLPIVDKLGALLDVDVISANIKHYSNVAFVLRRRRRREKCFRANVTWQARIQFCY